MYVCMYECKIRALKILLSKKISKTRSNIQLFSPFRLSSKDRYTYVYP